MKIGEKIRNAREDMDLSQEEVAKRIPMNQSGYSKIERDVQEPGLEQLRRICQILHLDPSYLLSLEEYSEGGTAKDVRFAKEVKQLYKQYFSDSNWRGKTTAVDLAAAVIHCESHQGVMMFPMHFYKIRNNTEYMIV